MILGLSQSERTKYGVTVVNPLSSECQPAPLVARIHQRENYFFTTYISRLKMSLAVSPLDFYVIGS